jgi:hypothetical protein
MDGQFEPLHCELDTLQINLNTVLNNEHVPEIECHIRTIEECALEFPSPRWCTRAIVTGVALHYS